jgi:protein TonB
MRAEAHYGDTGSKFGKIAIVAGLHLAFGIALLNMKMLVPVTLPPPGLVTPLPPPVVPPEPEIKQDFSTKTKLPDIVVPLIEKIDFTEPDKVVTRKEEKGEIAPLQTGEKTVEDTGGKQGTGGGEAKPAQVFTAALANAKDCVLPEYPKNALRNGDTGIVNLALLIGTNGQVTESRIQKSSGFRELDRAAVAALSMCKFKPATNNGVAQPAWGQMAYVWRLD